MNKEIIDDYASFLEKKAQRTTVYGIKDIPSLPKNMKPFQKALTSWALKRGRAALFEGTGLGKTIQQLAWARVVANYDQGSVLILTPLAVAQQTVKEAKKFGIHGVAYASDQTDIKTDIVVSNYERFEKFDIDKFIGIVLDESGIIKSHDGKTRARLTDACQNLRWRLCCTATPAPNDYSELGQHSEFLGILTAKEMLATFFVHDGSIRANDDSAGSDGWRLKRHAAKDFWRWLASWGAVVNHPRDLGFNDQEYDLPKLNIHEIIIPSDHFLLPASTLGERISARKITINERVSKAVEIITSEPDEPWLAWCNLNTEADMLENMIPNALQVAGRHMADIKVSRLLGFTNNDPLILVSKPTIAGHGMNWQHCARMIFVGLTDSFEQVYQAIRRCWRFGQTRQVDVYFIASELENAVIANLVRKEIAYTAMIDAMSIHMRKLVHTEVIDGKLRSHMVYRPRVSIDIPSWLYK